MTVRRARARRRTAAVTAPAAKPGGGDGRGLGDHGDGRPGRDDLADLGDDDGVDHLLVVLEAGSFVAGAHRRESTRVPDGAPNPPLGPEKPGAARPGFVWFASVSMFGDPKPQQISTATPKTSARTEELRASPPMFESSFMDRFTRVHPAVVPAIFVPVIAVFAYLAFGQTRTAAVFGWILLGYVVWTLVEYWLHRVVFHFEPERGIGARLHWMMHGVHHDHPNDPLRLVMPPSASIPLGRPVRAAVPGRCCPSARPAG